MLSTVEELLRQGPELQSVSADFPVSSISGMATSFIPFAAPGDACSQAIVLLSS